MNCVHAVLSCPCVPNKIFGKNSNEVFAYTTPKVSKIEDKRLGLIKISLMICIFVYVIIFQMWYKGEHFEQLRIEGINRLQWQQPTMDWCNPNHADCMSNYDSVEDLPYCNRYTGKEEWAVKMPCDYYDAVELPENIPGGVLIPTFIKTFRQVRSCTPGAKTCPRKWSFVDKDGNEQHGKSGPASPVNESFVVNADKFTVMIYHSFRISTGYSIDDFKMRGSWTMCDSDGNNCTTHRNKCVHKYCDKNFGSDKGEGQKTSLLDSEGGVRGKKGRRAMTGASSLRTDDEAESDAEDDSEGPTSTEEKAADTAKAGGPQVLSIKNGDVISLETLMAMAGQDLDSLKDGEPETGRLRGMALVVHINYHNMKPWTMFRPQFPPSYTTSVTYRPVNKFKYTDVAEESPMERYVRTTYGVYLIVQQTGDIGVFNPVHALVTLCAAMALLAVSNALTDLLALNVMKEKDEYEKFKYDVNVAKDFNKEDH